MLMFFSIVVGSEVCATERCPLTPCAEVRRVAGQCCPECVTDCTAIGPMTAYRSEERHTVGFFANGPILASVNSERVFVKGKTWRVGPTY